MVRKLFILISFISCQGILTPENTGRSSIDDPNPYDGDFGAYVYLVNPTVIGDSEFEPDSINVYRFITSNQSLLDNCSFEQFNLPTPIKTVSPCVQVKEDATYNADIPTRSDRNWEADDKTDQYYNVSTFYHAKRISDRFLESLSFAQKAAFQKSQWTIPSSANLNLAQTGSFWTTQQGISTPIDLIAKCSLSFEDFNAVYDPALNQICLGYNSAFGNFRMAQDPSIIYHEMGHALVRIMMNQRNTYLTGSTLNVIPYTSELGTIGYSEAGAINEGIADYFSHYMTNRDKVGEWGLKRFNSVRPITVNADSHVESFSSIRKLTYPDHLDYDVNAFGADEAKQVLHNAGQITSHYLAQLQSELTNTCSFPQSVPNKSERSKDYVIYMLNETLAALGDLSAKGSDMFDADYFFTNLSMNTAAQWINGIRPINYQRFYQVFAKNIYHHLSLGLCPSFTKDLSEKLLDQFGLLLFDDYADKGDGVDPQTGLALNYTDVSLQLSSIVVPFLPSNNNTPINPANRINSLLVSKQYIELPDFNSGTNTAFLVDDPSTIGTLLSNLRFKGAPISTSTGLAGVEYNNANAQFGPGEIVGLALNIFNNSNSPMGGVEVNGSDWDHLKLEDPNRNYLPVFSNTMQPYSSSTAVFSPCSFNGVPKLSEGAVTDDGSVEGDCENPSRTGETVIFDSTDINAEHPKFAKDSLQPICLVKYFDDDEERWVTQNFYRQVNGIDDSDCLNSNASRANFNPNSCLLRVIPGKSNASYSKIEPQKTWEQTMTAKGSALELSSGNIILLEINKEVPPGAEFLCRFRARIGNCQNCDSDDTSSFSNADYNANRPYKLLDFRIQVTE